jgi:septum formation protein
MTQNQLHGLRHPLVLASASPRRRELLTQVGFVFDVAIPDVDEEAVPTSMPADAYVLELARRKAMWCASRSIGPVVAIGADTTVVLDGTVMNKPVDAIHARQMLQRLQGRTHTVYTGVAIVSQQPDVVLTQCSATAVTFRSVHDFEIDAYVASGSPMDKAGAYGIQADAGALFVERVEGCYFTVVGLPLSMLSQMLHRLSKLAA